MGLYALILKKILVCSNSDIYVWYLSGFSAYPWIVMTTLRLINPLTLFSTCETTVMESYNNLSLCAGINLIQGSQSCSSCIVSSVITNLLLKSFMHNALVLRLSFYVLTAVAQRY